MLQFRQADHNDVDAMAAIAEEGKALLKSQGINQWQKGDYPSRATYAQDAKDGTAFVVTEKEEVVAGCAVTFLDERSYRTLDGEWLTAADAYYATIHRSAVARNRQGRGIGRFFFQAITEMAKEHGAASVRVDTHPDNLAMQTALEKAGFTKCGTLTLQTGLEAGDQRIGYEKLV